MKTLLTLVILAASAAAQPPATRSPLAPPPLDKVVASVDGKDVTYGDLVSMLSMSPAAAQRDPQLALENFFIMQYLATEGDKIRLADQSPLKEELEFHRRDMVAQAMLNRQRQTFPVAPAAIEAYYKANPLKYEQAKIKVIYIAFKPGATGAGTSPDDLARAAQAALAQVHAGTDRTEAQAKALAEEIVQKARGSAEFTALVEQYSEDPASKAAHGDFGVIKRDSTAYPEDLKKAAFALENGKVSDPLRQPAGFYIIQLEEKSTQPLSEVGTDVLNILRSEALNQWFQDLNKRFKPEIKDPAAFVRSGAAVNQQIPGAPPK